MCLSASEQGIRSIRFVDEEQPETSCENGNPHLRLLEEELSSYFDGQLKTFTCQTDPQGTEFQKRVWQQLSKISFGTTQTYGDIAKDIGQAKASRAVGGANNRNPIPIVIPCHRVIGSNQSLVGFACGVWRKQWMLEHEGIALALGDSSPR